MRLIGLAVGDKAIEIGAGTGIATEALVDRGLEVTAIEPSASLAELAESKVIGRAQFVIARFEDFPPDSSVRLLAAFNSWHWVDPRIGVDLAAHLVEPGGSLALVWTEVISWGEEPFEEHIAEIFGSPWAKRLDHVDGSLNRSKRTVGLTSFESITTRSSASSTHPPLSLSPRLMEVITRMSSTTLSSGSSTTILVERSRRWKTRHFISRHARTRRTVLAVSGYEDDAHKGISLRAPAKVNWAGHTLQLGRENHGPEYPGGQHQMRQQAPTLPHDQACRYRRTAIGVKMTISRADQSRARTRSLVDPTSTDRTASTIGVIGWYLAKGWSQPGIVLTGT